MTESRQETLKAGDRNVTVLQMLVRDYREWLKRLKDEEIEAIEAGADYDAVSWKLFDGFRLQDIAFMTDLNMDGMEDMAPSDIEAIAEVCKKVNPNFFGLKQRANL